MKYRLIIIISIALLSLAGSSLRAQEEETINMLFIGNSFTFRHDLNLLVEEIVHEGKPNINTYTERSVYGGQSLFQHSEYYYSQTFIEQSTIEDAEIERRISEMEKLLELTELPPEFIHYWRDVRGQQVQDFPKSNIESAIKRHRDLLANNPRRKWDYVVLQTWQDEYPDLNDGYAKYAKYLGNIARQQGAKVIFYMTAPDFQNEAPVAGPVKQEDYEEQIDLMIQLAQEFQPHAVVPVSMAINMIQQGGTDLTFRYVNDFHPNQRTAFLTTNMFYDAIFKESTEGFNFNTVTETNPKGMEPGQDPDGNPATVVFEGEEKLYLQEMADSAVMNFEEIWKRTDASGVSITNPPASALILGNSYALKAKVEPRYASNKDVTWEVVSGDAVTLDENGLVTAVSIGAAVVKVTTIDGGFSDTCEITVVPVPVSSVQVENCPVDYLNIDDTVSFTATVMPENAADKTIFWSSSDTEVATVDSNGLLTAKSPGMATITVNTNDGNYHSSCHLEVIAPVIHVSGVNLTGCASEDLTIGTILQLGASISPSDANDQSVSWSSSDTAVARVDEAGVITTIAAGNSTITVSTTDGAYTVDCNLTVTDTTASGAYDNMFSGSEINVYPNPASEQLYIDFHPDKQRKLIKIYNMKGQILLAENTFNSTFNLDIKQFKSEKMLLLMAITEKDASWFKVLME